MSPVLSSFDKTGEFRSLFRHAAAMAHPHWHIHIEVVYCAAERATYEFAYRELILSEGQVAVFSAIIPHRVVDSDDDSLVYVLNLPIEVFLNWGCANTFVSRILGGEIYVAEAPHHYGETSFAAWHGDLNDGNRQMADIAVNEISSFVRRLSFQFDQGALEPTKGSRRDVKLISSLLPRVIALLADGSGTNLTVRRIAEDMGLNPRYLTTRFRELTGQTLGQFIRQIRMARAYTLLCGTDMSVLDVAMEAGFGSLSQFYATIRASTRRTPQQLREQRGAIAQQLKTGEIEQGDLHARGGALKSAA